MAAILMDYDYWTRTKLAAVRETDKVKFEGETYILIQDPGKKADLIDERYAIAYYKMGRNAFISMLIEEQELTPERAMELANLYD